MTFKVFEFEILENQKTLGEVLLSKNVRNFKEIDRNEYPQEQMGRDATESYLKLTERDNLGWNWEETIKELRIEHRS